MTRADIVKVIEKQLDSPYESDAIEIAKIFIAKTDIVLEGGGGIGIVTEELCHLSNKVISYEPQDLPNIDLDNLVRIYGLLWVVDEECNFKVGSEFWNSCVVGNPYFGGLKFSIIARAFDLNKEIIKWNPTVLFLDVEGSEFFLFEHLNERFNLEKICVEIHPYKDNGYDYHSKLFNLGFKRIYSSKPNDLGMVYWVVYEHS